MIRRGLCAALVLFCGTALSASSPGWSEWKHFSERFIQEDGRVVDLTFDQKSTSEGQSYGLFFALVANDRARFDAILKWTSLNLAEGELGKRLPAWHWGKKEDGSWGVKDTNAAADGELWMAYTLLEAARLWKAPRYAEIGRQLLARIRESEIVVAGENTLLLPGPIGFDLGDGRYRYDPSYLPPFILRYLSGAEPDGPWRALHESYDRIAVKLYASGIAPDLVVIDSKGHLSPDPERPEGGYDAIRVYLWAGMSGGDGKQLVRQLAPFAEWTRQHGAPPEKIDPVTGVAPVKDWSPIGYAGALLPFLHALGDEKTLDKQLGRVQRDQLLARVGGSTNYYDQALILFGKGWLDGVYRFDDAGRLMPRWEK